MRRKEFLKIVAIPAVAGFAGSLEIVEAAGALVVKGSDTMVVLGQAWAEAYMEKHSGVNISVTGGGSGTGIAALINGTCDVCQASRAMRKSEIDSAKLRGRAPVEHIVGLDGLAVAVHVSNPISSLPMHTVAGIFTGKITDWSGATGGKKTGKMVVLSRESNSGTHVFFKEHVLKNANFAASALLMPSSKAIAQEISQNSEAIGYSGVAYFKGQRGLKILEISASAKAQPVEPTDENVRSGKYPISRPLFLYTPGSVKGVAADYLKFVKGAEGQAIVEKVGYVALKK